MHVTKRDGSLEAVSFDKVINRITYQCKDLLSIDPINIAQKVCSRIYDGVKTSELDELTAQICSSLITEHPEYGLLASRIIISNHQKNTSPSFSETMQLLFDAYDDRIKQKNPLISQELYETVMNNKEKLNNVIKYDRDYLIDYFGFKTLERSYLLKINDKTIERPQHLFMRVSLGIHANDIKEAIETYDLMSQKFFIHATPTLFNSGTPRPQMASCFLQAMVDDSIDGIFTTLKNCATISKYSGGIGLHIHNIRGSGSYIRGTNGTSNGIIPMLSVYNKTALYVDQCFRGDTHVYTSNGATKIERIKNGMKVLTSDGSFKPVLKVIKNQINKPTLRIRTNNSIDTIYVTKEHQIYAIKDAPSIPIYQMPEYIKNTKKPKPAYIDAKKLNTFDFIGYPIPQFEDCDVFADDIAQLSGIIFANGTLIGDYYTVSFYRDKGEKAKAFIRDILKQMSIEYNEGNQKNYNFIKWKTDKDKLEIIDSKQFYNMNKENTMSFIKGCLVANGCSISNNYKCMFFNTQSKMVGYVIRFLFLKIGILVDGFYKNNHNHYVICIPYTQLIFDMFDYKDEPADETKLSYFEYDNILWTNIKSIDEMKEFNGVVYDLNVQDNHNYTTEMGIVHNSGKRNGNFAIYLEPSHPDIMSFIELRKNHGNEAERCRELFTALWVPDLFMKRVQENAKWSLFCPDKCPELSNVYGEEYERIYADYEERGMYTKQMNAQDLWKEICIAQKETGTPFLVFKDSSNMKSNQKNVGTIKSSNLCSEILLYSDKDETAVCNLASIALPMFVKNKEYNFKELHRISKIVCKNINKVIDRTFYPTIETERSNKRHRPLGIGVQGLADVYALMEYPFDSDEARELNKQIFETIYHGALEMSIELAEKYGPYDSYEGSPISQQILQFDMWDVKPSGMWDFDVLKDKIKTHGVRNSMFTALMPTASTSQILGFNECFEPFTSNIYNRRTLAGEFFVINKYLINKLIEMGLWSKDMKEKIIENGGSIQKIEEIPEDVRNLFKTAFELHPKAIINQAAERGPFICQSQSMNLFLEEPDLKFITNVHFYSWKAGLKTGMYYMRTRPKAKVMAFTSQPKIYQNDNICESCSA